jgi:AraC family transcriptional regulator
LRKSLPIRTVDGSLQLLSLNFKNQIFHSLVHQFARDENDSGLSVKMVVNGHEKYRIGNRFHNITSGHFLVVNEHQQFECRVKSPEIVEGLCFYLEPQTVADIRHCKEAGHERLLSEAGQHSNGQAYFTEKVYGLGDSPLGNFLHQMAPVLRNDQLRQSVDFDAFFLTMAEKLVETQIETHQLMGRLKNEKPSTREEIFRRMSMARDYIEAHFLEELSLDTLAEVALTSKYHFLRCYKEVYGLSPYQYVLQKRLQHGLMLLQNGHQSLTEIALETGFTDRRAFNKAFKKAFGVLPSGSRGLV